MIEKMYAIEEVNPAPNNTHHYRIVELFDSKQDAEYVLKALEKVNINFNSYIIREKVIEKKT